MNLKSGSINQFEPFSKFKTLKEFNSHMEMWLAVHKGEFSKGELVGLKRLVRFAAKIPGVSNAKIGTVLKAIHEEYDGNGISRSTFKRMIQKAISLGIITVHETERKNGSQSSNLYVFNRFPKSEPPKEKELNRPNKTIIPSKTIKESKERIESQDEHLVDDGKNSQDLDYTYTSDRVPFEFSQVVRYFFPKAKTIEEYWRMSLHVAYRHNYEKETDLVMNLAIHSFKQMISKLKSSTVEKPIAYFCGILNNKYQELYYRELYEMGFAMEEVVGGALCCMSNQTM